ncbi:MAG TPA: hypothetical protein VMC42_07360 [Methanoregulaceae archaeon]|nr:hypothetical protein [Methanoregulaceae archaeon]
MKIVTKAILLVAVIMLFLSLVPAMADPTTPAQEKVIIYQTDFTSNPNWQTNNPSRYYWDAGLQKYHYLVQGGTGGYAFVPVDYDNGPFTLEYDWYPLRTDKDTSFQFGMGSQEMDITQGTNVLSMFPYTKYGKLMSLQVISSTNNKLEVNSAHESYNGPTVNFDDNQSYHIMVRYSKELQNADMKVSYQNNQTTVWSSYLNLGTELHTMNRLFISSVGFYGNMSGYSEGYIDNVTLYRFQDVTPVPTTEPPTTVVTTIQPTPRPTTMVPTTTKTALPWGLVLMAGMIAGLVFIAKKKDL